MSCNLHKVEYECNCGVDYGSCGRKNVFLMEYNRTVDIGTIVHVHHLGDKSEVITNFGSFTDEGLSALRKIQTVEPEGWSEEERIKFRQVNP